MGTNKTWCCVHQCRSNGSIKGLSFHLFPREGKERVTVVNDSGEKELISRHIAWQRSLKMAKKPSQRSVVCSLHFSEDCYFLRGHPAKKRMLKKNAVPNQNLPTEQKVQKPSSSGSVLQSKGHPAKKRVLNKNAVPNQNLPTEQTVPKPSSSGPVLQLKGYPVRKRALRKNAVANQNLPTPQKKIGTVKTQKPASTGRAPLLKDSIKKEPSNTRPLRSQALIRKDSIKKEPNSTRLRSLASIRKYPIKKELNSTPRLLSRAPIRKYSIKKEPNRTQRLQTHVPRRLYPIKEEPNIPQRLQPRASSRLSPIRVEENIPQRFPSRALIGEDPIRIEPNITQFLLSHDLIDEDLISLEQSISQHLLSQVLIDEDDDFRIGLELGGFVVHTAPRKPSRIVTTSKGFVRSPLFQGPLNRGRYIYPVTEVISNGRMQFKCTHCNYLTPYKIAMLQHIKIHTGRMPFACNQCSYKTSSMSQLHIHLRNHMLVQTWIRLQN